MVTAVPSTAQPVYSPSDAATPLSVNVRVVAPSRDTSALTACTVFVFVSVSAAPVCPVVPQAARLSASDAAHTSAMSFFFM